MARRLTPPLLLVAAALAAAGVVVARPPGSAPRLGKPPRSAGVSEALRVPIRGAGGPRTSFAVAGAGLYAVEPAFAVQVPGSGFFPAGPLHLQLIAADGRVHVLHQFDGYLASFHPVGRLPPCASPVAGHSLVDLNLSGPWVSMSKAGSETCAGEYGEYGDPAGPDLGTQLAAGSVRGPVISLERCPSGGPLTYAAVLDGPFAAYTSCAGGAVLIRDLAHPARAPVRIALGALPTWAGLDQVAISGSYLYVHPAGPSRSRITVFDWRRRRRLYQLTGSQLPVEIALDRRGRLVMAYYPVSGGYAPALGCTSTRDKLAWFSPRAAFAHVLPVRPCGQSVSVSGEQIAFTRLVSGNPTGNVHTDTSVQDTALTTFSGTPAHHLLENQSGLGGPDGDAKFAADGEVQVLRGGCGDATQLDFYPLARVLLGIPPVPACRVSLHGARPVTLTAKRTLRIRLDCPRGCGVTADVETPDGRPLKTEAPLSVQADPGTATLTGVLTRPSQTLAARLTHLQIALTVGSSGPTAPGQRNLGYQITRTAPLR